MIDRLDRYIWEKVCQWLRHWIDTGHSPVPISINVSRIDIFSMNVPAYLFDLMEKYQIPEHLIKVEYPQPKSSIITTNPLLRNVFTALAIRLLFSV